MGIKKPKTGNRPRRPAAGRAKSRGTPRAKKGGLLGGLFTTTQQRVLSLVFGQPDRAFGKSELIQLAGGGSGAVQREVQRLVSAGLVIERSERGRKDVQANAGAPLFSELCAIIKKTSGIAVQVRDALEPLTERIDLAVLFGSVAKEQDRADSDVDVLVVSDTLLLEDLFAAFAPLEKRLGRTVNPTLYTASEFSRRRQEKNPFLGAVLDDRHVILMGAIDDDPTPG